MLAVVLPRTQAFVLAILAVDVARRYLHQDTLGAAGSGTVLAALTSAFGAAAVTWFVLLQGLEAFRSSRSHAAARLSRLLVARGLILIVLELTVLRAAAWFTVDYSSALGVLELLWTVGASLLVLALLVRLPLRDVVLFALLVIALHNMLDGVEPPGAYGPGTAPGLPGILWILLHESGHVFRLTGATGPVIGIAHPLLPFAGIMAAGYALGALYTFHPVRRSVWLRRMGTGMLAAFVLLRALGIYGDPAPWTATDSAAASVLSFVVATPFPPSLQFLLAWLGVLLLLLAAFERTSIRSAVVAIGYTPVASYIGVVCVIHVLALGVTLAAGGDASHLFVSQPFTERPPAGAGFGLPAVLAFALTGLLVLHGAHRIVRLPWMRIRLKPFLHSEDGL